MNSIVHTFYSPLFTDVEIGQKKELLRSVIKNMQDVLATQEYAIPLTFLCLPFDLHAIQTIQELARQKMTNEYEGILIIGIGGSSAGSCAIYAFLKSFAKSEQRYTVWYADTIDPEGIFNLQKDLADFLLQGKNVLTIVISKSGSTLEIVINANVFLDIIINHYGSKWSEHVVTISDHNSSLHVWAKAQNILFLPIPSLVGGRFSVFSAAGLFPLACMGFDVEQLCAGARAVDFNDVSLFRALAIIEHIKKGHNIHNFFSFSEAGFFMGLWYRQLIAESLGKKENNQKKVIFAGITPMVSLGTIDLHSVAQLYLAGPHDKITTFMTVKKHREIFVKQHEECPILPFKNQVKIGDALNKIAHATMESYVQESRPFFHLELEEISEYVLGYVMQMLMAEIVIIGHLLDINIYDQPAVEFYKKRAQALIKE